LPVWRKFLLEKECEKAEWIEWKPNGGNFRNDRARKEGEMLTLRKNWFVCLLAILTIVAIPLVWMSELFAAAPGSMKSITGSSAVVAAATGAAGKPRAGLPAMISMGSLAPGTATHAWATGLADLVTKNTPMRLLIESHPGPGAVFPLMEKGSIDLEGCPSPEQYWAFHGDHGYKGPSGGKGYKGLRLLFMDAVYVVGLVTGADTGLKTTRDLKGKRIALVSPVLLSAYLSIQASVANGGWTEKDVVYVPVGSASEGKKLNVERKVDASSHPLGAADVEEISAARGGARFLALDPSPEARKRAQQFHPAIPQLIKAGTATGVPEDTWLNTFRNAVASWETLPDEAAYAILEALLNNIEKYKKVHVLLKDLTPQKLATVEAGVPFHPGAVKFYKEKGLWTDELENHQKALLERRR
jgi:TRAP transporter TAXI family solute receptor